MRKARLLLLAAALAGCAAARPAPRGAAQVGRPVELVARDLAGAEVDVAADRGVVRLVDFWATWCEPCREQMPALERLRGELGPRGLSIYAVSFDEDPAQIPLFLQDTPVGFKILWDKGGETWSAPYQLDRLPTTFLVDRKGFIRFVHEGFDPSMAREERRQIEMLLGEKP